MKKIIFSLILTLLLATGVRANQEGTYEEGQYERLTINLDIPMQANTAAQTIIIKKVLMLKNMSGYARVILEVETAEYNGKHTTQTYEKQLEGGHGYYYEIVTEETKVKGKITKEPTR